MKKRHWLLVSILLCLVIHISTAEIKKKKSSTKKKSGKNSKASRLRNTRLKPQADVPIGDDFEEDYEYDYELGMQKQNLYFVLMFGFSKYFN